MRNNSDLRTMSCLNTQVCLSLPWESGKMEVLMWTLNLYLPFKNRFRLNYKV